MMDSATFKSLFLPLQRKLYTLAYRITGTSQDAEDMVQETYLRLWQRRDEIPVNGNPAGYCVTVVRNLCLNHLHRKKPLTSEAEPGESDALTLENPETTLSCHETERGLNQLIERLPQTQRQVLMMREFEDMDYATISQALGLSEANVRVLLSRARKYLREQVRKQIQ